MKYSQLMASVTAVALTAACSTMQGHEQVLNVPEETLNAYVEDKPPATHRLYKRVLLEGKRNEALNHMRAGLAAMSLKDYANAAKSFDIALDIIEAVYANNPQAAEARSLWMKENIKDFKGEPYERALAYYYRGLLYMLVGDYENARASFKGGLLQSTLSYDEKFEANFALLTFLDGWASRCAGDTNAARETFEVSSQSSQIFTEPPSDHNVLVLAEVGNPPRKVAKGDHKELLAFEPGINARENRVTLTAKLADGSALSDWEPPQWRPDEAANIYVQAVTRSGRQIDGILEGKAQFKDTTTIVSAAAMGVGTGMMAYGQNDNQRAAGAIIALIGLIGTAAAQAMRPEADVRTWDNIPGRIDMLTLNSNALNAGSAPLLWEALVHDHAGGVIETQPVNLDFAGECGLVWVRARSPLNVADSAPGAVAPKVP